MTQSDAYTILVTTSRFQTMNNIHDVLFNGGLRYGSVFVLECLKYSVLKLSPY